MPTFAQEVGGNYRSTEVKLEWQPVLKSAGQTWGQKGNGDTKRQMAGATEEFGGSREAWSPTGMWARGVGVRGGQRDVRKALGCGKSPLSKRCGCQGLLGCCWVAAQQQAHKQINNKKINPLKCFAGSCQGHLRQRQMPTSRMEPSSAGSRSNTQPGGRGATLTLLSKGNNRQSCYPGNFQSRGCCKNRHYVCK